MPAAAAFPTAGEETGAAAAMAAARRAQSVSQSLRGGTVVNPGESRSGSTEGASSGIRRGGGAQIIPPSGDN
jgi:hypothetical protein